MTATSTAEIIVPTATATTETTERVVSVMHQPTAHSLKFGQGERSWVFTQTESSGYTRTITTAGVHFGTLDAAFADAYEFVRTRTNAATYDAEQRHYHELAMAIYEAWTKAKEALAAA
jgi:hypothetical protein